MGTSLCFVDGDSKKQFDRTFLPVLWVVRYIPLSDALYTKMMVKEYSIKISFYQA